MTRRILAAACLLLAALSTTVAEAAEPRAGGRSWHDVKCARYRQAFTSALARFGTGGLGSRFLADHAAFIASNCTRAASVCPRSPEEFRLANVMVELSMNFGAASTFAPFACR